VDREAGILRDFEAFLLNLGLYPMTKLNSMFTPLDSKDPAGFVGSGSRKNGEMTSILYL